MCEEETEVAIADAPRGSIATCALSCDGVSHVPSASESIPTPQSLRSLPERSTCVRLVKAGSSCSSVAVGPYPRSLQGFAPLAEVPE